MSLLKKISLKSNIVIGIISLIFSGLILNYRYFFPYMISIEVLSSKEGFLQIYHSSDKQQFKESNSLFLPIKQTSNFETYSVAFTAKNINNLRIDLPGDFKIKSITIKNRFHYFYFSKNNLFIKIKPLNDINKLELVNATIIGQTKGDDPNFQLLNIPTINPLFTLVHFLLGLFITITIFILLNIIYLFNKYLISKKIYLQKFIFTNKETDIDISIKIFNIFLFLIFAWFIFQMIFFTIKVKYGISPDEVHHFNLSIFYSEKSVFFIKDSIKTYPFGPVSTVPYFYHLLMGKLLILNIFHIPSYLYLRFLNILISITSVYATYLLTKEFTKNKIIQLTVLIVQTNILMYVFISSMISYDNLINLLSVVSFLLLFKFLKTYSQTHLLELGILMLVGSLTKITYPPLVILQFGILLLFSKKIFINRNKFLKNKLNFKEIILGFLFLLFLILNIKLYVLNIIKYHKIFPSADKVLNYEIATKYYPQFTRDISLLASAKQRTALPFNQFIGNYITRTEESMFGIMAHKSLSKYDKDLNLYKNFILLALILSILNIKILWKNKKLIILFFVSFAYVFIIMIDNFISYKEIKLFSFGLQGRYNFPILSTAITFLTYNLLARFSNKIKILILLLITGLFVYNGFFWFLSHATPDWYNQI